MTKRELRERDTRLADFEGRKKTDPAGIVCVPDRKWEYITVHPMSNETELLKLLGIKGSDCTKVDCYWHIGDDVVFLQVLSQKEAKHLRPGLYARWSEGAPPLLNLVAVVRHSSISQRILEDVMSKYASIGFDNLSLSKKRLKDQLTLIT